MDVRAYPLKYANPKTKVTMIAGFLMISLLNVAVWPATASAAAAPTMAW